MNFFRRLASLPAANTPPPPDAKLVCTPGVAQGVANVDPQFCADWEADSAAAGLDAAHGERIPVCAAYMTGLIASECEFQNRCRLRASNPPVLAP